MKKRDISNVIQALQILQSENLYVVGCTKNIVELKKEVKDIEDTVSLLLKRDSTEKWLYSKTNLIKDLVAIVDSEGNYVKVEDETTILEDQMSFTLHPDEIQNVIEGIDSIDNEDVDISKLSIFKSKALEDKENTGWFAKNENFVFAYNILTTVGLFV